MANTSRHYINNKLLYTVMVEYKTKLVNAERLNLPKPKIPDYIGEGILLICNKLGTRGNFKQYTYIDDMIDDAIVDCVAAVDNFDPDQEKKNPFGYFGYIAWNAFLRRLQKEKKQTYIKHKNFENLFLNDELWGSEVGGVGDTGTPFKVNEYSSEIIKSFEEGLTKAKKYDKVKSDVADKKKAGDNNE